ncbi:MAG: hypothetical protein Tsb0014_01410 [Pleurocapsa sp.]
MKLTTILSGTVVALCMPFAAQAQDLDTYEDYQNACKSISECDSFQVTDEYADSESSLQVDNSEIAQRSRRSRSSRSYDKYFAGFNLGLFLPEGGFNLGFGGSVYGGYMFNKNFGGDLEFLFAFGGLDDGYDGFGNVDGNYSYLGFYVNPRYEIPFSRDGRTKAFGAFGLGLLRTGFNYDYDFFGNRLEIDGSDTDFSYQLKGGVMFPLGKKMDAVGQIRVIEFDVVSFEGGLKFGF